MTRRAPSFLTPSRLIGFVCLATILLCDRATAYSLIGKTWPAGSNIVVHFSLGQPAGPLSDGNTSWNTAASPVLDMWNGKMANIHLSGVMNSTAPVSSNDGVNSVTFSSSVFGQSFGTGTLAVCYYMMQGSNLIEADVLFNTAQTFDSYRGPLRFGAGGYATGDIRRVFLHELGHGLGLNHSDGDNIMSSVTGDRETLSNDDIGGIQAMYGAPVPTPTPTPTPTPPSGSRVRSDFNVDAKPDVVWQNRSTGERLVWLMNGTTQVGQSVLPTVATTWQIAGTGDFNSDGYTDLVWQNSSSGQRSIWLMNGAVLLSARSLPTVSIQWQIAGTGDFNADGKTDLVWQNSVTGQRLIWLMNDTTMIGSRTLPSIATQWQIAATGDLNGDGQADLVWQNTSDGRRLVWLMNGSTMSSSRSLPTVSTPWQIAGTGDFNADGKVDIIWQNTSSGQRLIWLMNGTTKVSDRLLPTVATQWEIRNR